MVGNAVVFVSFAILLQCAPSYEAISCLKCTSQNNTMCMTPTDYDKETIVKNVPIIVCGHGVIHHDGQAKPGDFFCRKVIQTSLSDGAEIVTRGCGWIRTKTPCETVEQKKLKANVTTCQCFKNYCNGAAAHGLLLSLTVGAIAVFVVV